MAPPPDQPRPWRRRFGSDGGVIPVSGRVFEAETDGHCTPSNRMPNLRATIDGLIKKLSHSDKRQQTILQCNSEKAIPACSRAVPLTHPERKLSVIFSASFHHAKQSQTQWPTGNPVPLIMMRKSVLIQSAAAVAAALHGEKRASSGESGLEKTACTKTSQCHAPRRPARSAAPPATDCYYSFSNAQTPKPIAWGSSSGK
jgi:hypothetical protein